MPEVKLPPSGEPSRSLSVHYHSATDRNSASDYEFFDPMNDDDEDEEAYVDVDDVVDVNDDDDGDSSHCPSIDITSSKKEALHELRGMVEDAIMNNSIFGRKYIDIFEDLRDIEIWGVPLLPSKGHEGTDIVLRKFLKAKDYMVAEAFRMFRKTVKWRRDLRIDESFDEAFEHELESTWSMQGKDLEGRPVCYCMLGEFKNLGLRDEHLRSKEKYSNYIRWRLICLERAVRKIGFRGGESNSIIQIIDLKNAHSNNMKDFNNSATRKLMSLAHQHYPGLIHKNLFINVSVWYMAVNALNMELIIKKTKKKYCFVRSAKVAETLLNGRYEEVLINSCLNICLRLLAPENIPVQYGGLRRENDEFCMNDKVLESYARGNYITHIKIPANEVDVTLTWDLTVIGFNVIYKEEFIPNDDCSYEILIQQEKKMVATVRHSFPIREPGSILITIENPTYKKRPIFYRHKSKPSIPLYLISKETTTTN